MAEPLVVPPRLPALTQADDVLLLAPATVQWTSRLVDNARLPSTWGDFVSEDELRLKDTRGTYWANALVAPNRFLYRFPTVGRPERPWECELVSRIRTRYEAWRVHGTSRTPLRVSLFATPGSRNESYGDWVVADLRQLGYNKSELVLKRLHVQREDQAVDNDNGGGARYRSFNEKQHAALLARTFPEWIVRHEPETILDIHEPSVVDGHARDAVQMSRSYTCDFVLAKGTQRLCVESKPTVAHVTEEALAKCRRLRDTTLTRVLVLAGSGDQEDVRWLDVGPPESKVETWHDTTGTLLAGLGGV